MNEVTLFESGVINVYRKEDEQLVDARELHEVLEVKSPFNKWIKRRIEKYDFMENADYISLDKIVQRENGATTRTDYILKMDMAKELAMVEPNEKGKEIRRYFIKTEKQFKKWLQQRANGKAIRLQVTDAVRDCIPESPNKKFKYKHFTDLGYKLILDKNAKELRLERGLEKKANVRDCLTIEELKGIENIENEISVLIGLGIDYKTIKEMLLNKYKTNNPKGLLAQ
jgi:phage anti-repressor protein